MTNDDDNVLYFERVTGASGGKKAGRNWQVKVDGPARRPRVSIADLDTPVARAVWNADTSRLEAIELEADAGPVDERLIGFWEFLVESAIEG